VNPFTDLGSAGPANYRILAMGGDSCDTRSGCGTAATNLTIQNHSEVDGNVGVAPNGNLAVGIPYSHIYGGQAFVDTSGSVYGSGQIPNGVVQNSATNTLLNNAVQSALLASSDAAGMVATIPSVTNINNPTSPVTITGVSGINVVDLSNLVLSSNTNSLTLTAPSSGYFVINVTGNMALSGGADIRLAGGIGEYNVLYNVTGTGSAVTFVDPTQTLSTNAYGIVLAPTRDITIDGAVVNGEVISGNLNINVQNYGVVDAPEPTTLLLLASGLGTLVARRFRRS
jgi:choice-of-anchor A domain-containing protein